MTKPKGALPPKDDNNSKKRKLKKSDGPIVAGLEKTAIGQEVHGIVDGSFDAGYLLTVKIGDSPLVLRGLIFEPGLSVPLSLVTDIAPSVKVTARDQQVVPMPSMATEPSPAAVGEATMLESITSEGLSITINQGTHSGTGQPVKEPDQLIKDEATMSPREAPGVVERVENTIAGSAPMYKDESMAARIKVAQLQGGVDVAASVRMPHVLTDGAGQNVLPDTNVSCQQPQELTAWMGDNGLSYQNDTFRTEASVPPSGLVETDTSLKLNL